MSLIIENSNRHEHNGNGNAIDQIVSNFSEHWMFKNKNFLNLKILW